MTADATGRWEQVLDAIEAEIERFAGELASGAVVEANAWMPDADLGPIPESLRSRATSLSWRLAAASQQARDRRESLEGELGDLDRRRGAGNAYAAAGPSVHGVGVVNAST